VSTGTASTCAFELEETLEFAEDEAEDEVEVDKILAVFAFLPRLGFS
jgi:hypothetical protein